jgi:large subunit ribosomal protein L25
MANILELELKRREASGKEAANRARKAGFVPGVVYGAGLESTAIMVDMATVKELLLHHGRSELMRDVFSVTLEGEQKPRLALMKELVSEPLTRELLNIDFQVVQAGQKVYVEVPIHLEGECKAIILEGAMLDQIIYTLPLSAPLDRIPDAIIINVTDLVIGDTVTVADLHLEEGVEATIAHDAPLVSVSAPKVEAVQPAKATEVEGAGEASGEAE